MSIVQSYLDKPTFICNAHHKLRVAVEGLEMGLRNAEVRMDGMVGGWESFITNYPGLTADWVPEMASQP